MKKGKTQYVRLKCSVCSEINYTTVRGTKAGAEKLALKKFCNRCKLHTDHNETKIK
ncbi:MAG: 50S ribosomal protein L33 [Candidatus Dojkabacteria bacterium]|nr:MAG: 50S ribosomal protein L33 [Candidatus Dojkabacteria bacterium]